MKKSLLLTLLLFMPLVLAVDINIKDSYKPGETLIASIEGNFLSPLSTEDIYFYSDREQIPLVFDLARIQDAYYLYALLPNTEREYTIEIKDAYYFENGVENRKDIQKNLSVSGNITDFSVSPGFLIARNNFTIYAESKNSALTVSAKFLGSSQQVYIPAGQKKKIYFTVSGVTNFTLSYLELSALSTSYSVPVIVIPFLNASNVSSENITTIGEEFKFLKSDYNLSVNVGKEESFNLYLVNLGDEVRDIKINFSEELEDIMTLDPVEIDTLAQSESKKITLKIKTDSEGVYSGKITASSENHSATSYLTINSLPENVTIFPPITTENETCGFIAGSKCASDEQCNGESVQAADGACCLGACQKKPKSSAGTIIGVLLIVLVLGGIVFFYMKTRKGKTNPNEILKKRQQEAESRISGTMRRPI
jgi:hypothetical protein